MATQHGYFLIADITGYTGYLSASELDHAQQTLTALLNLLIRHTRPPLIISRLAGDAVISYGLRDQFFAGQTFVESIEGTYVDFRRAIELMVRNTTCPCNACRNIASLDLKFFVHYGEFSVQKLDAHDELVGSDVILLHRLTKNTVGEKLGIRAYTLYTDAALTQLGIDGPMHGLIEHEESYEHFAPAKVWVQDMHPVWEAHKREPQVRIEKELTHFTAEIAVSPEVLWNFLLQPEHFNVLAGGTRMALSGVRGGRVAPGTVYECYHGDSVVTQTVVEWHPFSLITLSMPMALPVGVAMLLMELQLEPSGDGTRFTQAFGRPTGPLAARLVAEFGLKQMLKTGDADMAKFKAHIESAAKASLRLDASPEPAAAEIGAAARESLVHA